MSFVCPRVTRLTGSAARFLVCLSAVVVFAGGPGAHAVPIYPGPAYDPGTQSGYTFPDLSFAPGGSAGNALGLGDFARSESGVDKGRRAVRWDALGGPPVELGNLGTDPSGVTTMAANAINPGGAAVGYAVKYEAGVSQGQRAVRWDASGTVATELPHLGTGETALTAIAAYAINPAGVAVGHGARSTPGPTFGAYAVRWDASGTAVTELAHLPPPASGNRYTYAHDVNDAGMVIGRSHVYGAAVDPGDRAIRWNAAGTVATELGLLGAASNGVSSSRATAINNAGTAVGSASKYVSGVSKGPRAVRWAASGAAATELGILGTSASGFSDNLAYDINDAGTAVGYARMYIAGVDKGSRPVRWDPSGTAATQLAVPGVDPGSFFFGNVYAINASGIAVGEVDEYDEDFMPLRSRAFAWEADGTAIDLNTLLAPGSGWVNLHSARGISDSGWITGIGSFDPDGGDPSNAYDRAFLMPLPEPTLLTPLALAAVGILPRRARR